jgi:competence protein ComEC
MSECLTRKRIFTGNILLMAVLALWTNCSNISEPRSLPEFTFSVIDVGEGLAQLGVMGSKAVAWDLGDSSHYDAWTSAYRKAGSPVLSAIVVSHSHQDHFGALAKLSREIAFSGLLITGAFEDTAYIRENAGAWRDAIRFIRIGQGDTLACLDGVSIRCIWPPAKIGLSAPLNDSLKNRYSLCFSIRYGDNSLLITSDVDTFSLRQLSDSYTYNLAHDIVVAAHHGSAGSIDPVFYGFVNPRTAIISCGAGNPYGHPSGGLLDLFFQMRVECMITDRVGTVTAVGNGYYWTWTTGE